MTALAPQPRPWPLWRAAHIRALCPVTDLLGVHRQPHTPGPAARRPQGLGIWTHCSEPSPPAAPGPGGRRATLCFGGHRQPSRTRAATTAGLGTLQGPGMPGPCGPPSFPPTRGRGPGPLPPPAMAARLPVPLSAISHLRHLGRQPHLREEAYSGPQLGSTHGARSRAGTCARWPQETVGLLGSQG